MKKSLVLFIFTMISISVFSQNPTPVYIWPGMVPGETATKHDPVQTPNIDRNVIRLTDVTNPAFLAFKPTKKKITVQVSLSVRVGVIVFLQLIWKDTKLQNGLISKDLQHLFYNTGFRKSRNMH